MKPNTDGCLLVLTLMASSRLTICCLLMAASSLTDGWLLTLMVGCLKSHNLPYLHCDTLVVPNWITVISMIINTVINTMMMMMIIVTTPTSGTSCPISTLTPWQSKTGKLFSIPAKMIRETC